MAAERWLFWCEVVVVVMMNVGERSVVWCGGVHVRFVGLGHTLIEVVVDCVENGYRRNNVSISGNMMMFLLCFFLVAMCV